MAGARQPHVHDAFCPAGAAGQPGEVLRAAGRKLPMEEEIMDEQVARPGMSAWLDRGAEVKAGTAVRRARVVDCGQERALGGARSGRGRWGTRERDRANDEGEQASRRGAHDENFIDRCMDPPNASSRVGPSARARSRPARAGPPRSARPRSPLRARHRRRSRRARARSSPQSRRGSGARAGAH